MSLGLDVFLEMDFQLVFFGEPLVAEIAVEVRPPLELAEGASARFLFRLWSVEGV